MKQITLIILVVVIALVGCKPKGNYNKVTINSKDSVKNIVVEIAYTDTLFLEVPVEVSDSLILASIQAVSDSLRKDSVRRDSLHTINFRRITKIINGGYNGYADREQIWIKAKEVIK